MTKPDFINSIAELAPHYDAFIFDLWGVMHDGNALFSDSLKTLLALQAAGKKIALLSNSPRPVLHAAANIATKFGLTTAHYDVLLTSGQLVYEALQNRTKDDSEPFFKTLRSRCLPIGAEHEIAPYLELGFTASHAPAAADFVLVTGLQNGKNNITDYQELLAQCHQASLPMICANPDRVVMRGLERGIAGGALAEIYNAMGGVVRDDFGKPYTPAFQRVLAELQTEAATTVMIGDNLATDIAGANIMGIDTLWITGGVHQPELAGGNITTLPALQSYAASQQQAFTYALPQLVW